MLKTVLLSTPVLSLLSGLALSAIGFGVHKLIKFLAAHPKLAPLELLAEDAERALDDGVSATEKAIVAGHGAESALEGLRVALTDAQKDLPDVGAVAKEEADILVNGVRTTSTTAGGATVNLPVIRNG